MSMIKLQINGKIIDSNTRQGLERLLVEAWDRNLFFKDLVGAAVTDGSEQFTIEFNDAYRFRLLYEWRFHFKKMPRRVFQSVSRQAAHSQFRGLHSLECRDRRDCPQEEKVVSVLFNHFFDTAWEVLEEDMT